MADVAARANKQKLSRAKTSQLYEVWKRLMKNKTAVLGLCVIIVLILTAIFAEQIAPYGYDEQNYRQVFTPPCKEYWMGTDNLGRDILSRVIYGSRISLQVGLISVGIAAGIGVVLGLLAGFYGHLLDDVLMRILDIVFAIPEMLLAISIAATLGDGLVNLMIAVGISNIPRYARVTRSAALSVKGQEYIEAARAIGASDLHIIFRYVLPNCMAPIIVQITMGVASSILSASALSFIGLGIQPPIPEWGAMLSAGRDYMRDHWYVVTFPGLMIMITVYALNLFGDGLRDALDPRLKN